MLGTLSILLGVTIAITIVRKRNIDYFIKLVDIAFGLILIEVVLATIVLFIQSSTSCSAGFGDPRFTAKIEDGIYILRDSKTGIEYFKEGEHITPILNSNGLPYISY